MTLFMLLSNLILNKHNLPYVWMWNLQNARHLFINTMSLQNVNSIVLLYYKFLFTQILILLKMSCYEWGHGQNSSSSIHTFFGGKLNDINFFTSRTQTRTSNRFKRNIFLTGTFTKKSSLLNSFRNFAIIALKLLYVFELESWLW